MNRRIAILLASATTTGMRGFRVGMPASEEPVGTQPSRAAQHMTAEVPDITLANLRGAGESRSPGPSCPSDCATGLTDAGQRGLA
ncbi:hypothetical protein [Paracraurococcus ruber]|uniref:hypothetical protein n=1 Tax=Paracraurococcus ruber TaxID=77675 RepID=UPI001057DBBA|nr:hypothetical protein [Paracraurococcus ruber]